MALKKISPYDKGQVEQWLRQDQKIKEVQWDEPTAGVLVPSGSQHLGYKLNYYPKSRGILFQGDPSKAKAAETSFLAFVARQRNGGTAPTAAAPAAAPAGFQHQASNFGFGTASFGGNSGSVANGFGFSAGFQAARPNTVPNTSQFGMNNGVMNNNQPQGGVSSASSAASSASSLKRPRENLQGLNLDDGGSERIEAGEHAGLSFKQVFENHVRYANWICGEQVQRFQQYCRKRKAESGSEGDSAKRARITPSGLQPPAAGAPATAFGSAPLPFNSGSIFGAPQAAPASAVSSSTAGSVVYHFYIYFDGSGGSNMNIAGANARAGWGVSIFANRDNHADSPETRQRIVQESHRNHIVDLSGPVVVSKGKTNLSNLEKFMDLGAEVASNNTGELTGFAEAMLWIDCFCGTVVLNAIANANPGSTQSKRPKILVLYDSSYAAGVGTGEKKAHKNLQLVNKARAAHQAAMKKADLKFEYVAGHSGDPGNDRVDRLAGDAMVSGKFAAVPGHTNNPLFRWTNVMG
ncbi:unnamed protein product [Amoebophrya sp. A120]|nr:unnamed protein product [Amoebophrya sp. A120]|eukprot:GSA120T00013045001.1